MNSYSRFAKMAAELSDSEDEEEHSKPMVTKYDKPTSFTIPGRQPPKVEEEEESLPARKQFIEDEFCPPKPAIPTFAPVTTTSSSKTLNGADNGTFLWSQTADEVCIRVRCPLDTKAKQVKVSINPQGQLTVSVRNNVLVDCKLAHGVWDDDLTPFATEEDRFQHAMTWEVEDLDSQHRCVVVRLYKRAPAAGVRMWWNRAFINFPSGEKLVDVTQMVGRKPETSLASKQVWEEAHKAFTQSKE